MLKRTHCLNVPPPLPTLYLQFLCVNTLFTMITIYNLGCDKHYLGLIVVSVVVVVALRAYICL